MGSDGEGERGEMEKEHKVSISKENLRLSSYVQMRLRMVTRS